MLTQRESDMAHTYPCRFQEHDFEVVALAFSQDSRLLATFGNEQ